jgi:hypothetical protein
LPLPEPERPEFRAAVAAGVAPGTWVRLSTQEAATLHHLSVASKPVAAMVSAGSSEEWIGPVYLPREVLTRLVVRRTQVVKKDVNQALESHPWWRNQQKESGDLLFSRNFQWDAGDYYGDFMILRLGEDDDTAWEQRLRRFLGRHGLEGRPRLFARLGVGQALRYVNDIDVSVEAHLMTHANACRLAEVWSREVDLPALREVQRPPAGPSDASGSTADDAWVPSWFVVLSATVEGQKLSLHCSYGDPGTDGVVFESFESLGAFVDQRIVPRWRRLVHCGSSDGDFVHTLLGDPDDPEARTRLDNSIYRTRQNWRLAYSRKAGLGKAPLVPVLGIETDPIDVLRASVPFVPPGAVRALKARGSLVQLTSDDDGKKETSIRRAPRTAGNAAAGVPLQSEHRRTLARLLDVLEKTPLGIGARGYCTEGSVSAGSAVLLGGDRVLIPLFRARAAPCPQHAGRVHEGENAFVVIEARPEGRITLRCRRPEPLVAAHSIKAVVAAAPNLLPGLLGLVSHVMKRAESLKLSE